MADIFHKISVSAPQAKVYEAVATREGLSGWWTTHVEGEAAEGSTLTFRFPNEGPEMQVLELIPEIQIKWRCTNGPDAWKDTILTFELEEKDGVTEVLFGQSGWESQDEFFAHCNTKWAVFLLSLKDYCETGKGRPFPDDLSIGK